MIRRGHQGKVDGNHKAIVQALSVAGCSVQSLASVGAGCPDLLIGYRGRNLLMEVKMPNARITKGQWQWRDRWYGHAVIVRTVDDALAALCGDREAWLMQRRAVWALSRKPKRSKNFMTLGGSGPAPLTPHRRPRRTK